MELNTNLYYHQIACQPFNLLLILVTLTSKLHCYTISYTKCQYWMRQCLATCINL
jgi:hypothetical protein